MKARHYLLTLPALWLFLSLAASGQTVPQLINYQGRLTNAASQPLNGVNVNLTFTFNSAASAGTTYLSVLQSNVQVTNGIYSVLIGSGTITPGTESKLADVFQKHSEVWMGIQVNSDPEMTPRSQIGSVPFALAVNESHTGAVYRWASFVPFDPFLVNWIYANNPNMTGGVTPQNWAINNGTASQMSSDKEVLRTLFSQKGYAGSNVTIISTVENYYDIKGGRVALALFRIKNTTAGDIEWTPYFYCSAYGTWGSKASISLNGAASWSSSYCSNTAGSITLSIASNRISTVIFVSNAGEPAGMVIPLFTRKTLLAFSNNSLQLPAGLEFVDDLDTATGGWEQ